jgi:hypothetical protein
LALVEFSVEEGISRLLHSFMNPEKPPPGYAYEMKKNADSVSYRNS